MKNFNCGKLTFVVSSQQADEIKKQLVNLGTDESTIDIKFVLGPEQYLVKIGSNNCNFEFPEPLKHFFYDNEWTSFRKIIKLSDGTYL
jgi:hypothetical protein